MTTAYPPIHHLSTTLISPSTALTHLTAYLTSTATDPSLHPNALLTENGPITPSSGANTGLVLHNLKRVEAGLKGEHLGADRTFEKYGGEGLPGLKGGDAVAGADEGVDADADGEGKGRDLNGEWQDKEEFEREQDTVQKDIGRRDNAVDIGFENGAGHVPEVKATSSQGTKKAKKQAKTDKSDHALEAKAALSAGDKKARKQAKKERRKEARTEEMAKKMREKNAEI